ncbi:MAG TPA: hypothetical protein VH562_05990 [Nitrosopumilaceae archaeon]
MISKVLLATTFLLLAIPMYAYAIPGTATVDVNGQSIDVSYDAAGVEVTGVDADLDGIELIFIVQVTGSPAILEITFDREFFDSKFGDTDEPFLAIADGDFVEIAETETTNDSRTLRLELPQGTEEVEIIGTHLAGITLEEPVVEEPVVEEPVVEEPEVVEEPVVEEPEVPEVTQPKTECGPGTVLKDGVCVLEETCGLGTHLEDGVCVLDEQVSSSAERPPFNQLIFGAGAGFVIAFIVMIFLWLIGKAGRQKNNS